MIYITKNISTKKNKNVSTKKYNYIIRFTTTMTKFFNIYNKKFNIQYKIYKPLQYLMHKKNTS